MRKTVGLLGAATLTVTLAGALAIPSSVGASARLRDKFAPSAITAAGNVLCKKVTGNATFSPKLTRLGTPGGDKFQLKLASKKCSGTVTGGGAVINVTGATLTVTGFWNPTNSCTGLTADTLGTLTWKFAWISSPAIAPTTVTTTGGMPWVVSGAVYKFNFPVGRRDHHGFHRLFCTGFPADCLVPHGHLESMLVGLGSLPHDHNRRGHLRGQLTQTAGSNSPGAEPFGTPGPRRAG